MSNRASRLRIHPLTLLTTVLLAGAILALIYLLFTLSGASKSEPTEKPTAMLTVIPAPTHTPTTALSEEQVQATSTSAAELPAGTITVGSYVKVSGTQGAGLRMRSDPGVGTEIHFVAMDEEVFLVIGGPVEKDDYTWWQLEAPYDKNRTGWSAESFLEKVESATQTP